MAFRNVGFQRKQFFGISWFLTFAIELAASWKPIKKMLFLIHASML